MQHHSHELHRHYLLYADAGKRKNFYAHAALKGLGISMVVLFIPALLLNVNDITLAGVMLFYAVLSVFTILWNPLALMMVDKFGSKIGLILGVVVMLGYLYGLTHFVQVWMLLGVLPAIGGLFNALYWGGYHSELMRIALDKKSGSSVALVNIVNILAISAAPLLGGILTDYASSDFMVQVAMVILVASILPLLFSSADHIPHRFSIQEMRGLNWQFFVAAYKSFAAFSVGQVIVQVLWPLLIFITLQSYTGLGMISAITAVLVVIISHYMGKLIDENRKGAIFRRAVKFQGSVWGLKVLVYLLLFNPVTITIVSVFRQLASSITELTLNHSLYSQADAKEIDRGQAVFVHEFAVHSIKAVVFGLSALALYLMPHAETDYYFVFVAVMILGVVTTPMLSSIVSHEGR
jgi:MFS family permease